MGIAWVEFINFLIPRRKMKYILLLIVLFLGLSLGQSSALAQSVSPSIGVSKPCSGLAMIIKSIALPKAIKSVGRLATINNTTEKKVLLVVKETDNKIALWNYVNNKFVRVLKPQNTKDEIDGFIHSIGPYLYFDINNPRTFYRSADNGKTWEIILPTKETFWSMALGENGLYYGTAWSWDSPWLYVSDENGKNWEVWKDFKKIFPEYTEQYDNNGRSYLRHLHDVAIHGNNMLVGTGDLARFTLLSQDGGVSWKKIWNEGFTAHLFLPNDRILLAGDKPSSPMAIYNFKTKKTSIAWSPSNIGWSGYIYSLLEKDNKYYLASHIENGVQLKYGVMGSCDGLNWRVIWELQPNKSPDYNTAFLADGPGKIIYLSLNGKLYQLQ